MNQDNSISGKDTNAWLGVLVFVVGLYLACTLIANIASLRIVIFAGFSIAVSYTHLTLPTKRIV